MPINVSLILALIVAVGGLVALYILVLPKKMDGKLSHPVLQFLHDYFHFKTLYIEKVMKFLFTVGTVACISIGFFMLFSVQRVWGYTKSYALDGLILMILGPVLLRLAYEGIMMGIMLVKNVMDINNKLKAAQPEKPAEPEAPQE